MRRPTIILAALAGSATLALAGCSGAADSDNAAPASGGASAETHVLKLAINQTEDYPSTIALVSFGERLAAATDGRWSIDVFPNEQLGAQAEALQLVSDGAVDLAIVAGPQLENLNKDFVVFNLPGVFKDDAHEMAVVNDPAITGDLYKSLEDQQITVYGGFTAGMRGVYTAEGPIMVPADLDGMKIRVQETDTMVRMIELMGGKATPMSFGEVYTALQSGVIDGAENAEPSYTTQKHNEVAKYYSYTNHLINSDYLVINTDLLASMSAEDQKIFRAEWETTLDEYMAMWGQSIDDAIAEAEASGTIFTIPDQAAFAEALAPLAAETITNDVQQKLYDDAIAAGK